MTSRTDKANASDQEQAGGSDDADSADARVSDSGDGNEGKLGTKDSGADDGEDAGLDSDDDGPDVDGETVSRALEACESMIGRMLAKTPIEVESVPQNPAAVLAAVMGGTPLSFNPRGTKLGSAVYTVNDAAAKDLQKYMRSAYGDHDLLEASKPSFLLAALNFRALTSVPEAPSWAALIPTLPFDSDNYPDSALLGLDGIDMVHYCGRGGFSGAQLRLEYYIDCDGSQSKAFISDIDAQGKTVKTKKIASRLGKTAVKRACK